MQRDSLNIGIIIPQFPSYTETFFLSQIIGLCERGHMVYVFCSSINNDIPLENSLQLNKYSNLKIISLNFKRLNIYIIKKIVSHFFVFINDIRSREGSLRHFLFTYICKIYFRQYNCNIYHFGYSGTAISYLPIINSLPGKIIISCRGTAENVKSVSEPGRVTNLKSLFKKADKIHCVSGSMAKTIKQYDAPDDKIFVNRPAVDITYFSRKSDYSSKKTITILSIGRLVFQKGYIIGILAMIEFIKIYSNFKWIIIGDGPEEEELRFNIDLAKLNHHVKLTGKKMRDEVLELYHTADIFFLPSVSEGIANVVLEAMAMQIPVVSSISGGIKEVITHDVDGILCENYDYESMAKALYALSINFEKRKSLGQRGRQTVEENFSLERYIDLFEQQYYALMK
jgi:colanic acid/amylovoran biosynthesis glycosyltransferase